MFKRKSGQLDVLSLSEERNVATRSRTRVWLLVLTALVLITTGVFAKNEWFPSTDKLTGKRTGWFGQPLAKNAGSSWNPLAAPLPTPTPQLKEYIYAGSRLVAVEDANTTTPPPADLAIWRPTSGTWWVMAGQVTQQVVVSWGTQGDIPVEGDYDGDGKTDFAVWRPATGNWYIVNSSNSTTGQYPFGLNGDEPVQADFDADGRTDSAVFRRQTGTWYIRQSSNGANAQHVLGLATDKVAPADFDGDGKADIAIYRGSEGKFHYLQSSNVFAPNWILFGQSNDVPVTGDYDGDGRADAAVWRPGVFQWHILYSSTQTAEGFTFGDPASDINVQNDYDGDGKTDRAFWRPSEGKWYIVQSSRLGQSDELRVVQWGSAGDIPVPAFYRRY